MSNEKKNRNHQKKENQQTKKRNQQKQKRQKQNQNRNQTKTKYQNQKNKSKREEQEHLAFVGALAGGLAHEIRNPLSTINVNLQLLKEDWEPGENERERKSLQRIENLLEETERLEETLNDFLKFARGFDLELQDEAINQVIEEYLEFFGPEARKENVDITCDFATGLPLVSIDVSAFRQAILNVLRNALEAMKPSGGDIIVRTMKQGEHVCVEVEDNGDGIDQERLEKVFEVYYSTKKGGSGLGLPISRRIIQEHDGTIQIDSARGEGTLIRIALPPADVESES